MSSMHQVSHEVLTEKKYSYRPSALRAYGAIFAGLFYTGFVIWSFTNDREEYVYFLGLLVSLPILVGGIYLAMWRIRNKISVTISKGGIHIPFDNTFVPFSKITKVRLSGDEVDRILGISVGDKAYEIHSMWIESPDDFKEIIDTIQEYMSSYLK